MVINDWHPSKRTNVIGALIGKSLLTVSLFECNINSTIFNCWVGQDLIPKLPSRSVIVMDNAAFHKNDDLKTMVKKAGHLIEYSPYATGMIERYNLSINCYFLHF